MKVACVVGARPNFVKLAPLAREFRDSGLSPLCIHTGQHYDTELSKIFFDELQIPKPDYNLRVGSGPRGWQTARMIEGVESVLGRERPDVLIVFGDTDTGQGLRRLHQGPVR